MVITVVRTDPIGAGAMSPVRLRSVRVTCICMAALYLAIGYFYSLSQGNEDPLSFGNRLFFAGLYILLCAVSYVLPVSKHRYLPPILLFLVILSFTHGAFRGRACGLFVEAQAELLLLIPLVNTIFFQYVWLISLLDGAFILFVTISFFKDAGQYSLPYVLAAVVVTVSSYLVTRIMRRYAQRYESLFDHAHIGIASHQILWGEGKAPVDYRIEEVNKYFAELVGMKAKDLVGKTLKEVAPNIGPCWLEAYKRLATEEDEVHFEAHLQDVGKYLEVKAYRLEGNHFVTVFHDITDRKITEEARRSSREQLQTQTKLLETILDNAPINIWLTDPEGKPILVNRLYRENTGIGTNSPSITEEQLSTSRQLDLANLGEDSLQESEEVITFRDNSQRTLRVLRKRITDAEGNILGVLGIGLDITEQKHGEEELKRLTYHDSLTGLYNRRYGEMIMEELDESRQVPVSIIMIDVNGLKVVNDSLGHEQGDSLLQKAAQVLQQACREEDIVARWGGDEFLILMPGANEKVAARICEGIQSLSEQQSEKPIRLSMSAGYATKFNPAQKLSDVLKEAEDHMYRKKTKHAQISDSQLMHSLQQMLKERGLELEEQIEQIEFLALALGERIGLDDQQLEDLRLLAHYHDIGQVATSEHILGKPGPLSRTEREAMKRHAEIGYRIAMAFPKLAPVAEALLAHHEWWDGSGYPRGLKGLEIPLAARIITIVDAFVSMVNERPYRAPLGIDEAIGEIKARSGTQFQPDLVEVFSQLMEDPALRQRFTPDPKGQ